jgi:hypothetical protein
MKVVPSNTQERGEETRAAFQAFVRELQRTVSERRDRDEMAILGQH